MDTLKQENLLCQEKGNLLLCGFDGIKLDIFNNEMKNQSKCAKGKRYSDNIKMFALTLNYYFPNAYNFCR